jgi:uncharacterized protein with FMN-binding domain
MRRSPIVLTATAAGLAAVLGFDAHQPSLPTASASATSTPSGSATPVPSAGSSGATRTATGDAIDTRYGSAQVRVTISGGRITDAHGTTTVAAPFMEARQKDALALIERVTN